MKKRNDAYIIYRVLSRIGEQANLALMYGREVDCWAMSKMLGRLEYAHFGAVSFEDSLNA